MAEEDIDKAKELFYMFFGDNGERHMQHSGNGSGQECFAGSGFTHQDDV